MVPGERADQGLRLDEAGVSEIPAEWLYGGKVMTEAEIKATLEKEIRDACAEVRRLREKDPDFNAWWEEWFIGSEP